MTQAQQPEALRLAEQCDNFDTRAPIAACLRAQHARIQELEMNLVHRQEVYTASLEQIVCLQDRILELEQGKCLHQIAEPAAQGLDIPDSPHLGDHWKAALLDGRTLERDENGMGWHPALPSFDEATDTRKFYEAFGMEICQVSAESELEWEEYDRLAGLEPNGEFNFSEWTPNAPEGEGWKLVSIHDTEDGPYAWWLRDAALASQTKQGGA